MPDRSLLGLGALAVAVAVMVMMPVTWAIRDSWRGEYTAGIVAGGIVCAVLVCAAPVIMAWKGHFPGRQRDAETMTVIKGSLDVARKALPMAEQRQLETDYWPQPVREDYTVEADLGR